MNGAALRDEPLTIGDRYLHLSFRAGRLFAGYVYLPRKSDDWAARSQPTEAGMVIDFAEDGRAIGIELTSPETVSLDALNRVLEAAGQAPATEEEFRPLLVNQVGAASESPASRNP